MNEQLVYLAITSQNCLVLFANTDDDISYLPFHLVRLCPSGNQNYCDNQNPDIRYWKIPRMYHFDRQCLRNQTDLKSNLFVYKYKMYFFILSTTAYVNGTSICFSPSLPLLDCVQLQFNQCEQLLLWGKTDSISFVFY